MGANSGGFSVLSGDRVAHDTEPGFEALHRHKEQLFSFFTSARPGFAAIH